MKSNKKYIYLFLRATIKKTIENNSLLNSFLTLYINI